MKKYLKPLLIGLGMLLIFSLVLWDNHKNRFAAQSDDSGLKSIGTNGPPLMGKAEWAWYDLKFHMVDRFHLRGYPHAHGVLVAKIDDRSLQVFGRFPWSRGVYSDILSYLYELGAEVVAFDAVFSEPEFRGKFLAKYMTAKFEGHPQSLQEKLKLDMAGIEELSHEISEIGTSVFGSAMRHMPKTVLGYIWEERRACNIYNPADPQAPKGENGQPFDADEASDKGFLHIKRFQDDMGVLSAKSISVEGFPPLEGKGESPVLMGYCPTVSRGSISHNARYQGAFSAIGDFDGLYRRIPLMLGMVSSFLNFIPQDEREFLPGEWFKSATFFPSLSLAAVAAYFDSVDPKTGEVEFTSKPRMEMVKDRGGRSIVKAVVIPRKGQESVRIETEADGTVPVNFYGNQETADPPIGEFSLGSIKSDLEDADFQKRYNLDLAKPLRGQIVIIGPTALGVSDLRPNPVQGDAAGVYLHATMAARMLERALNPTATYRVKFAGFGMNMAILFVFGLLATLWLSRVRALAAMSGTLAAIALFLVIDFVAFTKAAYVFDAMTVTAGLASVFMGIFVFKYFTEERDRAFVKGAFEKYVSPDLVDQIMADPKKLNLGGKKAELSVMFSDVRGFTTISEKMDAAGLARFMNEYLSPMTDIVQANKGTIDKYMGDAIMAIFGAPIEYKEHAEKAVDAALDMMARLPELVKEWATRGLPPIDIGIGINTGEMSVGNMGSSKIFSYTVMGDSVNLGSRLEGINKEYGTNIIVSEFTRKHLPETYLCRELDRVKVKGKKLPVTIFEVMGKKGVVDPAKETIKVRFEEALQMYYSKRFAEARKIFEAQADSDKTSRIYVQRCELWMEEAPEQDWDGSWTMKTK